MLNKYKAIDLWGRMMGSFTNYIEWQQDMAEEAEEDGAPVDAIYKKYEGGWVTVRDLSTDHEFRINYEKEHGKL